MPSVGERVTNLEKVLEEYIRNIGNAQMQTERELREYKKNMEGVQMQTHRELQDYKKNMEEIQAQTHKELQDYRKNMEEIQVQTHRELLDYRKNMESMQMQTEKGLQEFKKNAEDIHIQTQKENQEYKRNIENARIQSERELRDFKEEMRLYREEAREESCKWYRKWGEVVNKMGTVVEDMVAPNIPTIAREYFGCDDLEFFGLRVYKRNSRDKSKRREFDIIAAGNDKIIVNETKSTPKIEYITEFRDVLKEIYDYFPEYSGKEIIPIFSSLYIPDNVLSYLTKIKIYAMAIKDDTMDLLNYEKLEE